MCLLALIALGGAPRLMVNSVQPANLNKPESVINRNGKRDSPNRPNGKFRPFLTFPSLQFIIIIDTAFLRGAAITISNWLKKLPIWEEKVIRLSQRLISPAILDNSILLVP